MRSTDRHVERGRTRSTCGPGQHPGLPEVHGSHDWEHGDARLWCPGTDGSNPQIPEALRRELRKVKDE